MINLCYNVHHFLFSPLSPPKVFTFLLSTFLFPCPDLFLLGVKIRRSCTFCSAALLSGSQLELGPARGGGEMMGLY